MVRVVLCIMSLGIGAQLLADKNVEYWRNLRKQPRKMMEQPLSKYRPDGTKIDNMRRWPKHTRAFKVRDTVIKNNIDKQILMAGKQGWEAHDKPQDLFEAGVEIETNLMRLPTTGTLTHRPWSAYYWPIAIGGTSARYADPNFNDLLNSEMENDAGINYEKMTSYYTQPADFIHLPPSGEQRQQRLDSYSPAEKYDLLIGSRDFALTNRIKEKGRVYMDENGVVPFWMGICHGWAVASYASPRPQNSTTVKAADGKTMVKFYPDDVRALVSLKWSAAAASSWSGLFIGGRCNMREHAEEEGEEDEETVNKDEKTGRILNAECFDTNPGTWHTVVTNKIGRHNKTFIMDATFDAEVWNQPVYSYEVTWYHPRTDTAGTLAESIIPIDDAWRQEDIFAAFRNNSKAKKIVNVAMKVTYVAETEPQVGEPKEDRLVTVTYQYDLELDAQHNIVGGEWHTSYHPDFLWTKKKRSRPQNNVDSAVARLVDTKRVMKEFVTKRDMSVFNKAMLGRLSELSSLSLKMDETPLEVIIYGLVELSR